ncbi:fibropellin-3-like [Anneissia japonica]|uniref:fibropellin-3-like n=1 Tax=Anneissia japonica TaxID=1529436 RepID=UPI001425809E|nr:fibropellin-3-like [Anneissia japonica]
MCLKMLIAAILLSFVSSVIGQVVTCGLNYGTCPNDGTCISSGTAFKCQGDPCSSNPCLNGGTCTNTDNGGAYSCNCNTAYKGLNCNMPVGNIFADDVDMFVSGTQVDELNRKLQTILENIAIIGAPCSSGPCLNGGTCMNSGTTYMCSCSNGFNGNRCETSTTVDYCATPDICGSQGTCEYSGNYYKCLCNGNMIGGNCEVPGGTQTPCSSGPCLNGGTCMNVGTSYVCNCINGFNGDRCEASTALTVLPCSSSPCKSGGVCSNVGLTFNCRCQDGYSGTTCEYSVRSGPMDCITHPCENGAICVSNDDHYECVCPGNIPCHLKTNPQRPQKQFFLMNQQYADGIGWVTNSKMQAEEIKKTIPGKVE